MKRLAHSLVAMCVLAMLPMRLVALAGDGVTIVLDRSGRLKCTAMGLSCTRDQVSLLSASLIHQESGNLALGTDGTLLCHGQQLCPPARLAGLNEAAKAVNALSAGGITTIKQLAKTNPKDLKGVLRGISPANVDVIIKNAQRLVATANQ